MMSRCLIVYQGCVTKCNLLKAKCTLPSLPIVMIAWTLVYGCSCPVFPSRSIPPSFQSRVVTPRRISFLVSYHFWLTFLYLSFSARISLLRNLLQSVACRLESTITLYNDRTENYRPAQANFIYSVFRITERHTNVCMVNNIPY